MYLTAISEYDQVLQEDNSTNRMEESLKLFQNILDLKQFEQKVIILFLNKTDLFEEKIRAGKSRVSEYFPDYDKSDDSIEDVKAYFEQRFTELNTNERRLLFLHFTTAINKENIERVFSAVETVIFKQLLRDIGIN